MGMRPAPSYANIFMARRIDQNILHIIKKYEENGTLSLKFFKRFLDDLFLVFYDSTQVLHEVITEINKIHPNIKLTMQHTYIMNETNPCNCPPKQSIPFLDTSLMIKDGKIQVDLFKKPTDKNQYLLPTSCHPPHCTDNIPFSLALRIVRICSDPDMRDQRLSELQGLLTERNYKPGIIISAINKARLIPRTKALQHVAKPASDTRPALVIAFHSRLPDIPSIINKHWRAMTSMDPYLHEVFPDPPLVSYKRQRNINDFLIKAKVHPKLSHHQKRKCEGMRKCNKPCVICPYIMEGKVIKSSNFLTSRIQQHLGYIRNYNLSQPTGHHFNLPGHNISNVKVTILEKVKKRETNYRKEREHYLIKKFNTFYKGMNKMP